MPAIIKPSSYEENYLVVDLTSSRFNREGLAFFVPIGTIKITINC